jgi:hypothetical protein
MRRALIFSHPAPRTAPAFTLVEVVMAIGVLAGTVVTVLVLQGAIGRSVSEISSQERASQLMDASMIELARLRDRPVADGQPNRLDALAAVIPASDSSQPLKLVGARDGLRVVNEGEADDPTIGVPRRDRYYVIEVRQQPAPLDYRRDAGYLALRLTVRWPYQIATGAGPADVIAADLAQTSVLGFNGALTP